MNYGNISSLSDFLTDLWFIPLPGPVVITATFIGYKVGGFFGALTATASIFMPSTILVALVAKPFIRYKDNPWVVSALKGILASFIGLLALVVAQLAKTNITDYKTALFALVSLVLFVYTRLNPVILLVLGIIVSIVILKNHAVNGVDSSSAWNMLIV